jgi:hypothetical protein
MWHQWRPVFNGRWTERDGTTRLVGEMSLSRGVFVVIGIITVVLGSWLWAGLRAVVRGVTSQTPLDPMVVLTTVAMPVLFGLVAFGIFWTSYRLYLDDRIELRKFLEGVFAESRAPDLHSMSAGERRSDRLPDLRDQESNCPSKQG